MGATECSPHFNILNLKMKLVFYAFYGTEGVFPVTEGSKAEIAFTAWTEASPWSTYDIYFC